MDSNNSEKIARLAAKAASDKKASEIMILNMQGLSNVTDYFLIASATSTTQVQAIADNIEKELDKVKVSALRREGYREARWVLLDFGDLVAHIFVEEDRAFYNLERLWADAPVEVYED
ncbi:ribosome silencing factor [Azotosporobacter soli]|uniref:ribosome silencing factor n=1 Tax=Azotosporobacter soli TaxID=3055040 RepID=UPI0031FE7916